MRWARQEDHDEQMNARPIDGLFIVVLTQNSVTMSTWSCAAAASRTFHPRPLQASKGAAPRTVTVTAPIVTGLGGVSTAPGRRDFITHVGLI